MTRRREAYAPRLLTHHDITLDIAKAELSCRNTISLALREVRLLELFITNPEVAFSTDELLSRFWEGEGADGEAVWIYISFLRNKLKSIGSTLVILGESGGEYMLKAGAAV